mgnify:CR=1 FL=1
MLPRFADYRQDHVLEDLDFACENISRTKDETGSLVTKWVAYALKSRICLFEASFRKYHTELGLTDSADEWYQEAVRAAETVMKESGILFIRVRVRMLLSARCSSVISR